MFIHKHFKAEDRIHEYLPGFLTKYLGPTVDASKTDEQRKIIRASAKLNELLFDNIMGLKEIMNFARFFDDSQSGRLTQSASIEFFMELTKIKLQHQLVLTTEMI